MNRKPVKNRKRDDFMAEYYGFLLDPKISSNFHKLRNPELNDLGRKILPQEEFILSQQGAKVTTAGYIYLIPLYAPYYTNCRDAQL